jgi:hypothetical protein
MKPTLTVAVLMSFALALPAFGRTYKSAYPVSCSEVWAAVKDTLGDPEHYAVAESDDAVMTASYHVKHAAHVTVTGAILQRTNRVTLVPNGGACEMRVVSNFSGWEHSDREDFKKRVDESLVKLRAAPPSQPAKPEPPAK